MKSFRSLESLRAWMAWWIVLGHALQLVGAGTNGFLSFVPSKIMNLILDGGPPVDVFIIISGFVITHLMINKQESYVPYITRRAFRIFPIYLVTLFIAIATIDLYQAAWVEYPFALNRDMRIARFDEQQGQFWTHLGLHLTMLHGIVPDNLLPFSSTSILSPAWSLSLEWQFYLVAPFLITLLIRNMNFARLGALLLLGTQWLVAHQQVFEWQYNGFLPKIISYFVIGILSRLVLEKMYRKQVYLDVVLITAFLLLFVPTWVALIWIVFFALAAYESKLTDLNIPILRHFGALVAFNGVVAKMGSWSYSTYLIHIPVFSVVLGLYVRTVGVENVSQTYALLLLLASFPVIVLLSWTLYNTIEDPFRKLGSQIAKRKAPPSAAVTEPRA
ncbi:acyltransferase family protein [Agrobacterium fabrum]|uniref:acyltransferase family protein n=1 Tax=Agrobacterium fabrum TaxID=1176649 RepID=UPI002452F873|nr:acyltransferase [Agrobacterium fabrum]